MAPAKSAASPEPPHTPGPFGRWLVVAALVVLADQWLKWLVVRHYELGDATVVTSYFNIVRAHNTGAAFSFLAGAGGWQRWLFVALALGVSLFIAHLLRRHARERLFALALSLILGGALGNVLDRILRGYVVDFLDFHWRFLQPLFFGGHYPAFNLADAAITAGAIGLILNELLRPGRG